MSWGAVRSIQHRRDREDVRRGPGSLLWQQGSGAVTSLAYIDVERCPRASNDGGRALKWFERFGDIPGVSYDTPATVDRARLPGRGTRPKQTRDYEGKSRLTWEGTAGSRSPAWAYSFEHDTSEFDTSRLLQHLAEGLEVPGEPADYHFAIQATCEALWKRRKSDPSVLGDLERLCWLDIALVQATPEAVVIEGDSERGFVTIRAFGYLSTLYEREGAWNEALEVAELAHSFDQPGSKRDELLERVAQLRAEGN